MYEKRCGNCQSLYRIINIPVPLRDKDSIDCEVCGAKLLQWNGGVVFQAELIESKADHANGVHSLKESEDHAEFLEDLAAAKEAEEEYDRQGIDGTIPYSEYRTRRLESEPSV